MPTGSVYGRQRGVLGWGGGTPVQKVMGLEESVAFSFFRRFFVVSEK